MGIAEDHEGIIELPPGAPVGESFATAAGLDDAAIDVKVTPNRADCLGVHGIARDLAAAGLGRLILPKIEAVPGRFASPIWVPLATLDQKACPLFVGRTIRGVKNGPSPRWLQDRLTAIGLRPISTLVDITNFITYDLNRPLHAFDTARIEGDLVVREARPGESLMALNGRAYELDGTMTVIADDAEVLSLGGVIGGGSTGCTAETPPGFVVAARFVPPRAPAAGRQLHLQTPSGRHLHHRGAAALLV